MLEVLLAENSVQFNDAQYNFLRNYLPVHMLENARRFRRWQDAQAYLLGKYLLSEGLKNFGFVNNVLNDLKFTEYGRPFLVPDIDFNISHSGKFIICAISDKYKVGVDIEEIHAIEIKDFTEQFTDTELTLMLGAENKYAEFFKYWTIKEAVIKADGRGLSIPLKEIKIDLHATVGSKQWFIHRLNIDQGYVSHLVCNELLQYPVVVKKISLPL